MDVTTGRQKAGLAVAGLLSVINVGSAFAPTPDGADAPPVAILVLGVVLGVVGLVGAVIAWRTGNQAAFRVTAGALVVNAIASLPVFFVDVPAGLKIVVALSVLITVLGIVLMFSAARRPVAVLD